MFSLINIEDLQHRCRSELGKTVMKNDWLQTIRGAIVWKVKLIGITIS